MRRALVVDDSRAMRAILSQFLKAEGFEVSEAGDGDEALRRLEDAGRVDVVLVDWNMPGMDGLTLVRTVRADPRFAAIRILMVTTETDVSLIQAALDAGANEYLMKPFVTDALREKLLLLGMVDLPDAAS